MTNPVPDELGPAGSSSTKERAACGYREPPSLIKDVRAFDPVRQGRWSFGSQQAALRRLGKAFAAFFRRVKSGDTPGCR
jgi:putative transposase